MTILFTLSFINTLSTSIINVQTGEFEFRFGFVWLLTISFCLFFVLLRFFYEKTYGKKDGYNNKSGELSAADEREIKVGEKASVCVYRMIPYILMIGLILSFASNFLIKDSRVMGIFNIAMIGLFLCIFFVIYTVAWIILENRL